MKIKNRKSFVQIGTHVYKDNHWHKKEPPKKIHQYIMFKVCILKRKEKNRKYKKKKSILFESQLLSPIDLVKN